MGDDGASRVRAAEDADGREHAGRPGERADREQERRRLLCCGCRSTRTSSRNVASESVEVAQPVHQRRGIRDGAADASSNPAAVPTMAAMRSTQPRVSRLAREERAGDARTDHQQRQHARSGCEPSGPMPIHCDPSMARPVAASITSSSTRLLQPWPGPATLARRGRDACVTSTWLVAAVMRPAPRPMRAGSTSWTPSGRIGSTISVGMSCSASAWRMARTSRAHASRPSAPRSGAPATSRVCASWASGSMRHTRRRDAPSAKPRQRPDPVRGRATA